MTNKNFVADVAAKYGQRLRRFFAARLSNTSDTAELAQEVFLRLLRVEQFEQICSPRLICSALKNRLFCRFYLEGHVLPISRCAALMFLPDRPTCLNSNAGKKEHRLRLRGNVRSITSVTDVTTDPARNRLPYGSRGRC
jgi:hypothetical protein